jgi:hypothetical protein
MAEKDFAEAIAVLARNFNSKLRSFLPEGHDQQTVFSDSSLYYQKLNSTYLRSQSRVLLKHCESWPLAKIFCFFKHCMTQLPDRTFQMTVMFFMMYHYHAISADLSHLAVFQNWVLEGIFDRDSLTDFAEYCLLPLVNYSHDWILAMLDWAKHSDTTLRRAAALAVRKCGVDKDKSHIAIEVCRILLQHCDEPEIKTAIGQIMRQVGKKQKGVLRVFLEENLAVLPRKSLCDGIVRLSRKEQDFYLAEHLRLTKRPAEHSSLVTMDLLEQSLNKSHK